MAHPVGPPQWPVPVPARGGSADKAHRWFVVYAAAMVVISLLYIALGLLLLLFDLGGSSADADGSRVQGVFLLGVGVVLLGAFSVGPFLPRRPWGWVYGLILIGLGLSSCCTWPATIPLMIQWLKPEMKARFGSR